jgi:hypothetical protein
MAGPGSLEGVREKVPPELRWALALYAAVRLPLELLAAASEGFVPKGPGALGMPPLDGPWWLKVWLRWDSGWYVRIIRDGYSYADCTAPGVPCPQASIAFLPGYPLAVRALTSLGAPLSVASFVVTHVALVLALWGLLLLGQQLLGERSASSRAAVAMLAFPSAIFLSVGYAEVVFLALGIWGLVFLERGRVLPAAVLLTLGALTRSQGMLLLGAVGLVALARREWRVVLAVGGFGAAGIGAYLAWQHVTFHDALAFLHARRGWGFVEGRAAADIIREHWERTKAGALHLEGWLDFAAIPWLAVVAVAAWRKLGARYGLFAALVLLVPLAQGQVWALSRIALCVFPGFLLLGAWTRSRVVALGLLAGGLGFVALGGLRFVNGLFTGT